MKKMFKSCLLVLCCFSLVLPLAEARITKFYKFSPNLLSDVDENGIPADVDGRNDILFKGYVNTRTSNALVFGRSRITNLSRRFVRLKNVNVNFVLPIPQGNFTIASDDALISPRGRYDAIYRGTVQ